MKFFKITRKIVNEEDGAVTVDWVVLTAAVVGLGAGALMLVRSKTMAASGTIGNYLASMTVNTSSASQ